MLAAAMRWARGVARGFTMFPDLSIVIVACFTSGFTMGLPLPREDMDRGFRVEVELPARATAGGEGVLMPSNADAPKDACTGAGQRQSTSRW
jgi:hypothetical protein